jgi:N-acyl-D-aspartate/D-glutamate deacylase
MFGNCGVGFAPVKKHHRGALMDLMEGVEEIPNPVLSAGLTWEWETFPEFMDALERRPHAIDIAAQAAHLPLRVYVMGDRAVRREAATRMPKSLSASARRWARSAPAPSA